jgi:hypothetical protein
MSTVHQINDQTENLDGAASAARPWVNAVVPWPEPVEAHALLDSMAEILCRFVLLPRWAPEALALWVLHTYAFELRDVTVYLGIESPEKRCGKTTLLGVLNEMVNRPIAAANISSPAFFRVIQEARPTLLIDEAHTLLAGNEELRGILNSGYTRNTAYVVRVGVQDGVSSNGGLARFSCWCPKVMTAIGRLPETLEDRCIVVRMQRKLPHERCERLREMDRSQAGNLRRQCARFVADHAEAIAQQKPPMPAFWNDRAADLWEPLLVLADLAGEGWPERGRKAAEVLTNDGREDCPIGSLFMDILLAFVSRKDPRLFSRTIVAALNQIADRPWRQMRKGKEIDELWLARQLAPYGIHSHTLRIEGVAAKGYTEADFIEVFRRYIPRSEVEELQLGAEGTEQGP